MVKKVTKKSVKKSSSKSKKADADSSKSEQEQKVVVKEVEKEVIKEKNYRPISLMNIVTNISDTNLSPTKNSYIEYTKTVEVKKTNTQ